MKPRSEIEPMQLARLRELKDAAKASGDAITWELLVEIWRLQWVVIRANHLAQMIVVPDANTRTIESVASEVRRITLKEPAVQKDETTRAASLQRPPKTFHRGEDTPGWEFTPRKARRVAR
jgi:hypothetical protein